MRHASKTFRERPKFAYFSKKVASKFFSIEYLRDVINPFKCILLIHGFDYRKNTYSETVTMLYLFIKINSILFND